MQYINLYNARIVVWEEWVHYARHIIHIAAARAFGVCLLVVGA